MGSECELKEGKLMEKRTGMDTRGLRERGRRGKKRIEPVFGKGEEERVKMRSRQGKR